MLEKSIFSGNCALTTGASCPALDAEWITHIDILRPSRHLTTQPIDFRLARGAILVIVMLQIGIVNDLAIGPRWLALALEQLALLIPLSLATAWTLTHARGASTDAQWASIGRNRRMVRLLAFVLTAICTLMNFGALARLIAAILAGHAGSGKTLLLDAVNIWTTNVVIFALWFWSLDRGGPAAKRNRTRGQKRFRVYPTTSGRHRPRRIQRLVARLHRLPIPCFYKLNGLFSD